LAVYREKYPLLRSFERVVHRRTCGLIANSHAVFDQLEQEVTDRRKLGLIHNGIEMPVTVTAAERKRVRQLLGIADDALVIVVIANLMAYKGYRDLFDALGLIKGALPKPWIALAIGRDFGIRGELEHRAQALGISDNIKWLGEQAAAERLLPAGDIFVLPSHQEGFSNALLEAMAASLAVIATAVGGNLDAIVDNECGLLVPPHDPAALAAGLVQLASDSGLRYRLAGAARRRVEQRFTLGACVDRYEKLYRAMAAPNPAHLGEILVDDMGQAADRPPIHEYANQH